MSSPALSDKFKAIDWSKARREQVVIIGSGPAGFTAGIYAGRAQLNPLILKGDNPGGQLMITTDVENYPAFLGMGPDLVMKMEEQAVKSGATAEFNTVAEVDFSSRPFKMRVSDGTNKGLVADSVIIATGAVARFLGIPSEERFKNQGVSACATCDGPLYRGKTVVVVGGGDSAAEEAMFLTRLCPVVHLVHRRDSLRASKVMAERVLANPKIKMHWDSEVEEVVGKDSVEGIKIKNLKTKATSTIEAAALFVAIGHVPMTSIFKGWINLDSQGYIKTKPGTAHTNIAGVFACGDAQDHVYRQAVTAAGTGCMAAIDAERWMAENPAKPHA